MVREENGHHEVELEIDQAVEPGVYSWLLADRLLYGDTLVASLFGLDPVETTRGLPLETYLARLHHEDRAATKRLINKAVLDGLPYHAEYRVMDALGQYQWVIALGRCFHDRQMMPVMYCGIVYPISQLYDLP